MKREKELKQLMIRYYCEALQVSRIHRYSARVECERLYWRCCALVDVAILDSSISIDAFDRLCRFRDMIEQRYQTFRGI